MEPKETSSEWVGAWWLGEQCQRRGNKRKSNYAIFCFNTSAYHFIRSTSLQFVVVMLWIPFRSMLYINDVSLGPILV
jgi:hypothetical protein